MEDCLVYFFTGFLDSGKTSVISSWLGSENLKGRTAVIICTEEGETEYPENATVINCETTDVTKEMTFELERKYKPDFIFIEWNGSVSPKEFFDVVDVPERWALAATVIVVDCSTYGEYYKNMQTFFADYYRFGDMVIFNRVDESKDNLPKLRGSVKAVNPGVNISFFNKNNEVMRIEDHLPYDLSANPCAITADDFGLFYTDALDNAERYSGKRVSLIGQAGLLEMREFRGKSFILERKAYTCCAADVGKMGILCMYNYKSNFPAGQWLKVTGTLSYYEDDDGSGQKVEVPCLNVEDYAVTSKPDNDIIYFN